jgi:hypothetical protein
MLNLQVTKSVKPDSRGRSPVRSPTKKKMLTGKMDFNNLNFENMLEMNRMYIKTFQRL